MFVVWSILRESSLITKIYGLVQAGSQMTFRFFNFYSLFQAFYEILYT